MSVIEGRRSVALAPHRRQLIAAVVAAPVLGSALVLGSAGTAAADPPDYSLTVGIPYREAGPGLIDNRLRSGGKQILSEQLLALSGHGDTRFGAAMLIDDLDDDGFDDMIVGAPGSPDTDGQKGSVYILFGTSTGISAARAVTLTEPASVKEGDAFGTALSLTFRTEDDGSTPQFQDLWVGAPDHDIGAKGNAGAVYRYSLNTSGVPAYLEEITQDSPLVPGVAEAGDQFGAVLAARAGNGTIVGVPGEDIGRAVNAGTVQQLRIDPVSHALKTGQGWNQNTPGVPGKAESGDRFGASMTGYAGVVGIPGEDIGTEPEGSDVGRVLVGVGSVSQTVKAYGFQGGNVEGLGFGTHFPAR